MTIYQIDALLNMIFGGFTGYAICTAFRGGADYKRGYRHGQEIGRLEGMMWRLFASFESPSDSVERAMKEKDL